MHKILVIGLYFPLDALHVSDCISPSSGATLYEGAPKSNRTLNLVRELEVVVRCTARCCGSTQYSSNLPRGVNLD